MNVLPRICPDTVYLLYVYQCVRGGINVSLAVSVRRFIFFSLIHQLSVGEVPRHPLVQSAIAGLNISPCPGHPCSPLPGHESPCGIHGACQPHMEEFSCQCPLGRAGVTCEKKIDLGHDVPRFGGDSFMTFRKEELAKKYETTINHLGRESIVLMNSCYIYSILGNTNTFNLRVKVVSSYGMILYTGGNMYSDYLSLGVSDGYLQMRFNLGSGEGVVQYNGTRIDDGRWHRIKATRLE